jgi:hypothetical protein
MEETKTEEKIIGKFKPKRAFLNFVSAVNGAKIRFIRDIAFIKGEKLSGVLEGAVFKITICDEDTINFEEVDTKMADESMIRRLINEIDEIDVTGYAQKFVVGGLEFTDVDGKRCYLEVEHKKPIDKLKSLFDEDDKPQLSTKGASLLDSLFGSDEEETLDLTENDAQIFAEAIETPAEPNEKLKNAATSYMEEQFRKMNEEKVAELKKRISEKEFEIKNYQRDISTAETRLKKSQEDFGILETRLESMTPGDEPNGWVFYVSEEQKLETGLDESSKVIADKIADIMKLKKEVLFDYLTGGFYKIKIAKADDITNKDVELTKDILEKVESIDINGKISIGEDEFEYRGELTWHQLVGKMIRKGFIQNPEFDKLCQSNSYESKEEVKEEKGDCNHENCNC